MTTIKFHFFKDIFEKNVDNTSFIVPISDKEYKILQSDKKTEQKIGIEKMINFEEKKLKFIELAFSKKQKMTNTEIEKYIPKFY
jgi:hypothetical protein